MNKKSHLAFIVGAPRSGTTLLMSMLNCSPEIHVVPENRFFLVYLNQYKNANFKQIEVRKGFTKKFRKHLNHRQQIEGLSFGFWKLNDNLIQQFIENDSVSNYTQAIITLFQSLQLGNNTKKNPTVFIEKNPIYTQHISAFSQFNSSIKYIGIIRNYRDSISSRVKSNNWQKQHLQYYANYWKLINRDLYRFYSMYKKNIILIRYERLIKNPGKIINNIMQFLETSNDFHYSDYQDFYSEFVQEIESSKNLKHKERWLKKFGDLSKPINNSNLGAWQKRLTIKERELVDLICSATAQKFDYELDDLATTSKFGKNISYYKATLNYYLDNVRFKTNPNFNIFLEKLVRKAKII